MGDGGIWAGLMNFLLMASLGLARTMFVLPSGLGAEKSASAIADHLLLLIVKNVVPQIHPSRLPGLDALASISKRILLASFHKCLRLCCKPQATSFSPIMKK